MTFELISDDPVLVEYRKYFPHFTPTIFQQELILRDVENIDAWREAMEYWLGNSYREASVLKLITYYQEILSKHVVAKPKWMLDRDACTKCDERGYVLVDGKHQVCRHI